MMFLTVLIPWFAVCAYASGRCSVAGYGDGGWFWLSMFLCAVPVWPIVALTSKNLVRDALVYDAAMTLAYAAVYMWMGKETLEMRHVLGVFAVMAGLVLVR